MIEADCSFNYTPSGELQPKQYYEEVLRLPRISLAGVDGFEPSMAGPKPAALPLGYTPRATVIISDDIYLRDKINEQHMFTANETLLIFSGFCENPKYYILPSDAVSHFDNIIRTILCSLFVRIGYFML